MVHTKPTQYTMFYRRRARGCQYTPVAYSLARVVWRIIEEGWCRVAIAGRGPECPCLWRGNAPGQRRPRGLPPYAIRACNHEARVHGDGLTLVLRIELPRRPIGNAPAVSVIHTVPARRKKEDKGFKRVSKAGGGEAYEVQTSC